MTKNNYLLLAELSSGAVYAANSFDLSWKLRRLIKETGKYGVTIARLMVSAPHAFLQRLAIPGVLSDLTWTGACFLGADLPTVRRRLEPWLLRALAEAGGPEVVAIDSSVAVTPSDGPDDEWRMLVVPHGNCGGNY